jgi:uncharacterized protein (TIRG00374 family)
VSSETSQAKSRPWLRRNIGNIVKVVVSAGLIIYLFLTIDMKAAGEAILHANLWIILLAFALVMLTFPLRALRWQALIRGWGARISTRKLVLWYMVGSLFNSVLPTGFGGDLLRIYELTQQVHDPIMAANSVIVDRYLGIMVLLAMGLLGLPFAAGYVEAQVIWLLVGLFVAGLAAGILLLNQRGWRRVGEKLPLVGKLLKSKLAGLEGTASYYSARSLLESIGYSVAFNVINIGFTVLIALALGIHISLRYFIVFTPLTSVALMLPSVGGLGVREMSYAALYPSVGVPAPLAVSISLLIYLKTLVVGLIGTAIYLASGAGDLFKRRA